ncbi:TRAP transporter small permease [Anaerotruncus rubiinfantis]|uniref:TRAP transporter small permease n=1 Tax=Anaerotruncus rubiinfantis TaxID=1720200 RepID=UPI00082A8C21|nr:TRAP transporter small permease [Anaerotruncus rubiinfantis]
MKILLYFEKAVETLFQIAEYLCRIMLFFMVVVVTSQVFLRAIFNYNIRWCEEVVLILMIYITFLSMAIGIKDDLHIRIEVFCAWLPKTGRRLLNILDDLTLLFISFFMFNSGFQLMKFTSISKLPVTQLPTSVTYLMIGVGGALSCFVLIGKLLGRHETSQTREFIEGKQKEGGAK